MTSVKVATANRVAVPGLHMAGADTHYDAHVEVGSHGFAIFLTPDAEYLAIDINGTPEELDVLLRELTAALASRAR